ncbi:hypothetical protein FI667_g11929, partial [Globisporangium splendens]
MGRPSLPFFSVRKRAQEVKHGTSSSTRIVVFAEAPPRRARACAHSNVDRHWRHWVLSFKCDSGSAGRAARRPLPGALASARRAPQLLFSVLSDNQPSYSDASSTESSGLLCGVPSDSTLSITADKTNESTPPDTPSSPPKTITLATRQRNKYREQLKKELHKLRALVAELEAEVLAFRQGKIVVSSDDKAKLNLAWQRIAKNQLEYRRQAETENKYLKLELQRTIHLIQSIGQILGNKRGPSYALGPRLKQRRRASSQLQDADGFTELAADIDASFRLLDIVFQESGLDQVTSDLPKSGRIKTNKNHGGSSYLELTSAAIEPFDSRMTADNLWCTLLNIYLLQTGPGTEQIWRTDDAFAVRYHPEDPIDQIIPPSKLVMKKFTIENDKVVVVWRACSQLTGSLIGTMADETGWTTVQPIADSSGFQSSGSILRTCVQFVQKPSSATATPDLESKRQASIEAFSDVVSDLSDQDGDGVSKMMENLLLDDMRQK